MLSLKIRLFRPQNATQIYTSRKFETVKKTFFVEVNGTALPARLNT